MNIICFIALVVTVIPFWHVLVASMSNVRALVENKVFLWPVGLDFTSYLEALKTKEIWIAYGNTIFYAVFGTLICLFVTITAAYPLSRPGFKARRTIMLPFSFTMYFSGGPVPTFQVVKALGLYGHRMAIIIPAALSVFNLIICKTSFEEMPEILVKMGAQSMMSQTERFMLSTQMKYAVVIVSIGPILLIYPFMQKYFIKGVMIGAIKG